MPPFFSVLDHHYPSAMAISPVPTAPISLDSLKSAKNSVIGNPTAKVALAQDPAFVAGYVLEDVNQECI